MYLLVWASLASAAPVVTVTGDCPGPMEIDVVEITRGAPILLLFGDGPGDTPMPGGPCVDQSSGLGVVDRKVGPVSDPDADGRFLLLPTVPEAFCDYSLSVIDASTCEGAPAVRLGLPDRFEFTGSQVIDGAEVTCSSVETTLEYTQCSDLQQGGLYFPNGISCGPEWSFVNSSYSDTHGFCASLTGSSVAEVYYTCAESITRATWFDGVWGTTTDNGYSQDVRCYYP